MRIVLASIPQLEDLMLKCFSLEDAAELARQTEYSGTRVSMYVGIINWLHDMCYEHYKPARTVAGHISYVILGFELPRNPPLGIDKVSTCEHI